MALISYYDIGFASVENGGTTVTGSGTQWLISLRENDVLVGKDGRSVRIASIESATSMTLARPWPGDSQTDDIYEVRITPAPSEITASVRELLEKLRQGLWLTPNATGTLAERAGYNSARRGFIYMQTDVDPFVVFVKQTDTEGDWSPGFSPQVGPRGLSGPYTDIAVADVETLPPGSAAAIETVQEGDEALLTFYLPEGHKGWTIEVEQVVVSPTRVVQRVADFIGGTGAKPVGIGLYVGVGGLVADIADAVNVKGETGERGPAGINWQGVWSDTETYYPNDVVTDPDANGDAAAWIALTENTDSQPRDNPANWSLFPGSFPAASDYGLITEASDEIRDYGAIA